MALPMTTAEINEHTTIVDCAYDAKKIVKHVMSHEKLVAIDVKGHQMERNGFISFVSLGLFNGDCYLFDVCSEPAIVQYSGLVELLGCPGIVKVIFDCRLPTFVLNKWYHASLVNVFDVQIACSVIDSLKHNCKPEDVELVNLAFVSHCYGRRLPTPADHAIAKLAEHDINFWYRRPMYDKVVEYAAREVMSLLPEVYFSLESAIPPCKRKTVINLIAQRQSASLGTTDYHIERRVKFIENLEQLIAEEKAKLNEELIARGGCGYNTTPCCSQYFCSAACSCSSRQAFPNSETGKFDLKRKTGAANPSSKRKKSSRENNEEFEIIQGFSNDEFMNNSSDESEIESDE